MPRFEDHRRSCDRVREESARRDHPDNVLSLRVRFDGPANLHGGADAEMRQSVP